ncbi:hypothetical protein AXX12_08125 [Anaerosporomusa subterranea]|uniref:Chromosome partition protein Smc n=1 Tax=Anaerosporomusa subterranea TaxID=1794912 RepID=A0A154BR38_ANASB|nr:DUF3084 domain-containing protein [Anaerosporomusa subterranea]KYZ76391.1 hypothetical protein AXX12_08125 [Anaerosporomusa subterranea]
MFGIALIVVIVIMGGAIAYIGDKLGTKVGKKKLTVFGLRPKHTSILVTIITGFLIAATTLGILTLVSTDVRTALFGMEALKAELGSLSEEVFKQNGELTVSREALEAKTKEYLELTQKIQETAKQLTDISRELETVAAERDRAAAALGKIQTDYAVAKNDLGKAQQEIDGLVKTKQQLDQRVAELNSSKIKLEDDVKRLNDLTTNLKRGMQIVREGSIVFRAGEALATSAIRGGETRDATAKALGELILRTNFVVLDKMGMSDKRVEALWISQTDFDELVNLLDRSSDEYVVRILASGNTIYGEPVIGQFEVFPNNLLYAKDKAVYSETITAPDSRKAEETMLLFLQKVNAEAVRKGVLPDPLQGTVGAISGSQLFDAVKRLQGVRGPVTLSAITTDNIHTVGPLKINIEVKPMLSN